MIREMTLADAVIVCFGMRPEDAACVRAAAGREPGDWFAVDRWQTSGPAWVVLQDGAPWLIFGLSVHGWVGTAWLVARPGFTGWREVVRMARRVAQNAEPLGVHRIEALVLHGWSGASRLADRLGLRLEGIKRGAGANGEAFEVWGLNGRKTQVEAGQTRATEAV